tara:strand:+ start:10756 stop:10872 length:117 start_codon:yes stop_codon:yes gene_type:complete
MEKRGREEFFKIVIRINRKPEKKSKPVFLTTAYRNFAG